MAEPVYKIIELTGTSKTNIESAIQNAISKASETVRYLRWFEVIESRGEIQQDRVSNWQVTIKAGFKVELGAEEKAEVPQAKKEPVAAEAKAQKEGPAKKEEAAMAKYRCKVCGYLYDPQNGDPSQGIKPGTPFEELPDSWQCPECGVNKDQFEKVN